MTDTVLVTGGAGRVATRLRPSLRPAWRLRLADTREPETPAGPGEEVFVGDLSDPEVAARTVDGVDAVMHLAGIASPAAPWDRLRVANVDLSVTMLEAALRAGVRRVVYASSNHAAGRYDIEGRVPVTALWPARPCCLYGASKAAAEAIGSFYADARGLSVICLRLGWACPLPHLPRALRQWISPGDLGRLANAALTTERHFGIYYGMSDNTRGRWDLAAARDELGYIPLDDAEDHVDNVDFDALDPSPCQGAGEVA
ncbi:MAG: NAD-dependent epimerase/dehydratase family protein [Stackebrandtia sp.]